MSVLPCSILDGDFLAGFQAIEKCWRGQHTDVGIRLRNLSYEEDIRVEQVAQ